MKGDLPEHPRERPEPGSAAAGGTGGNEARAARGARFSKGSRLLKHADFDRVYRQGRRHFSANMTVFWLRRAAEAAGSGPRIGFTVGRVLGGSVLRNRIKRRTREAVRRNLPGLGSPVDVVINPKKAAATTDFRQLAREVETAFGVIEGRVKPPRS